MRDFLESSLRGRFKVHTAVNGEKGFAVLQKEKIDLVLTDVDFSQCAASPARTLFWHHRRPELYGDWLA